MSNPSGPLRRDLESISVDDETGRHRVIACDASGTFTRVTADAWNRLIGKGSGAVNDPRLWALASQAGWTQQRTQAAPRRWSPLAIRIPLVGIDRVAACLANYSGWLFGPTAAVFWISVFAAAIVAVASRWALLVADFAELPSFLTTCDPLLIVSILAVTKLLHELGHAVMCRRVGAKCGDLGIMLFCGMPCPYCDVTQIWREPSALSRMAVMFAGIYVEWILTSLAVVVWCLAWDPVIRMYAVNVMILCGVSTFVFNANPLMRYDGYYVLADWLASPDLRSEARMAFRSGVQRFVQKPLRAMRSIHFDRAFGLSVYHAASFAYRIGVLIAIAGLVVRVGDWLGFRMATRMFVLAATVTMVLAARRSASGMIAGQGDWNRIPGGRRWIFAGLMLLALVTVLCVPLPRFRSISGTLDVAQATSIYLPRDSRLIQSNIEIGDVVKEGQLLAVAESTTLEVNTIRSRTRSKVAAMQSVLARHRTVSGLGDDRDWMTYETAQQTAEQAAIEADRQRRDLTMTARRPGVIVPAPVVDDPSGDPSLVVNSLVHTEGRVPEEGAAWCRIADPSKLAVVFMVDSKLRSSVHQGDMLSVVIATRPGHVHEARIDSIAESDLVSSESWHTGTFEIRCRLRPTIELDLLANLGANCTTVIRQPRRSIARDVIDSLAWWIYE